jgi:hypothetical protein
VIPDSLFGLILFAASLGPGYVFEAVAERRRPRPSHTNLSETVGMAVIGASFSVLAAITVLLISDATSWLNSRALADDTVHYMIQSPLRAPAALAAVFVLGYVGAAATAHLSYPRRLARVKPGAVPWHHVFMEERPSDDSAVFVTVHFRDGKKIAGTLSAYSLEQADNREIALIAPLALQPDGQNATRLKENFVVLREKDVLYITGHYLQPSTRQHA